MLLGEKGRAKFKMGLKSIFGFLRPLNSSLKSPKIRWSSMSFYYACGDCSHCHPLLGPALSQKSSSGNESLSQGWFFGQIYEQSCSIHRGLLLDEGKLNVHWEYINYDQMELFWSTSQKCCSWAIILYRKSPVLGILVEGSRITAWI